jgi:hypothetical protein
MVSFIAKAGLGTYAPCSTPKHLMASSPGGQDTEFGDASASGRDLAVAL